MKDIIQEARELLEKHAVDFWGVKQHFIVGEVAEVLDNLTWELEQTRQQRDAALEQVKALEAPHV